MSDATETNAVLRYTSAPDDFDGFGTTTVVPDAGIDDRGRPIRLVMIPARSLEWQETRYGSGMHVSVPAGQLGLFRSIWTMKEGSP